MWTDRGAPATDAQLDVAASELQTTLPTELRDFLRHGDGANGWFPDGYVELFSIDRMIDENVRGDLHARFPNLLLIGTDGSREYLALDLRTEPPPVVMLDITAGSPADVFHQAASLHEFLEQLPSTGLRFS